MKSRVRPTNKMPMRTANGVLYNTPLAVCRNTEK